MKYVQEVLKLRLYLQRQKWTQIERFIFFKTFLAFNKLILLRFLFCQSISEIPKQQSSFTPNLN